MAVAMVYEEIFTWPIQTSRLVEFVYICDKMTLSLRNKPLRSQGHKNKLKKTQNTVIATPHTHSALFTMAI